MPTSLNELLSINMSYQDILDSLEDETDGFTVPEGEVAFDDQYEAGVAISILKNHYNEVDNAGLDTINEGAGDSEVDSAFIIKFSDRIIDDFDFPDESVEESFKLRESNETNAMMDLMLHNDQFKDDPYVGSFWYDPNKDELFGTYSVLASDAPLFSSTLFDQKVKTGSKLHKDIWRKEQFKNKDPRFKGDHTLVPRGRVFQLEDGTFEAMVGDWIDDYPQAKEEIIFEFQLPEDTKFVKDEHWNIGRGFSDEFLKEDLNVLKEAKNDTLNPNLWDENNELKPEVKETLLKIANIFIEKLKADDIPLDVKDIIIVGSSANYNYTPYSDIDLHLIADLSQFTGREKELAEKLYMAKKSIFNDKYTPTIKGTEVEIYVEPAEDKNNNEIPDEVENESLDEN